MRPFLGSGNKPRERSRGGRTLLWPRPADYRGLVFGGELGRAELGPDARPRPFADPHIPDGLAVPGGLPVEMGGRGRGMSGIIGGFLRPSTPSDGLSSRTMSIASPIRTSTSDAPSFFAARNTRAISAWVKIAGRGGILRPPEQARLGLIRLHDREHRERAGDPLRRDVDLRCADAALVRAERHAGTRLQLDHKYSGGIGNKTHGPSFVFPVTGRGRACGGCRPGRRSRPCQGSEPGAPRGQLPDPL